MKISRNAMTLLISMLVGLLILEASLRLFKMEFAPLLAQSHQPCIYVEDPKTGYRYRANATDRISMYFEMNNIVEINSRGFHDIEHAPFGEGSTRRILVIGDSLTAGLHVPTNDTWTQVLERELNDGHGDRPLEVINLALDGTGTDIHTLLLQEYLPVYEPEVVIVAFYKNDIRDMTRPMLFKSCYKGNVLVYQNQEQKLELQKYVDENEPGQILGWLFKNYYTFRLPVIAVKNSGRRIDYTFLLDTNYIFPSAIGVRRWSWGELPDNIDQRLLDLKSLSEEHGFELFVIPVPAKESRTLSLDILRSAASGQVLASLEVIDITPHLQEVLEARKISYLDLFWRYDSHFNSKGHEMFAIAVSIALLEYNE